MGKSHTAGQQAAAGQNKYKRQNDKYQRRDRERRTGHVDENPIPDVATSYVTKPECAIGTLWPAKRTRRLVGAGIAPKAYRHLDIHAAFLNTYD